MDESIDELRSRWESDPSPKISLQLAEEYRRRDRREEAIEVLARALESHPEHTASRVAKGRYHLEMGQTDEARGLLEAVVTEDPTHLVAGKLLVELYLQIDDRKRARDRLDLYKLLNEGDPEIEILERRLAGEMPSEPSERIAPIIRLDVPRNGEPFGSLLTGVASREYWLALAEEGIFPVAVSEAPTRGAATAAPPEAEQATPESEIDAAETARLATPPVDLPPVEAPPGATVTLANLYLSQGHFDEAERAFLEVLDREPENSEATAGLEEIRRQRAASVHEMEEPVSEASGPEASGPSERDARKVEVLKEYLRRIRSGSNRN